MLNDFSNLKILPNLTYSIDEKSTQFLDIKNPSNYLIIITIPDYIFEWFITVFDDRQNELMSDWMDHYGSPNDILKIERQQSIEEFAKHVAKYQLRIRPEKQLSFSSIEFLIDNKWVIFSA